MSAAVAPVLDASELAIGYARNSKLGKRERGNNMSIDRQRSEIASIAARHGLTLVGIIEEEDTPGASFDRPEWKRARAMIEDGEVGAIVSYDLHRISRAKAHVVTLAVDQIEHEGGRVFDRTGQVSVDDEIGEMITTMRALVNHSEWRGKAKDLDDSVARSIARGAHLNAPYGYAKDDTPEKKLVVVPDEAELVVLAFELRAEGKSWPAIADALNETGKLPHPRKRHGVDHQARWTHRRVWQIVHNRVYLGTAYNGLRVHEDAHEAIVSEELFKRANRSKGSKPKRPSEGYLLTGLVRCASCGYSMIHSGDGHGRDFYACQRRECKQRVSVPARALEAHVVDEFAPVLDVDFALVPDDTEVAEAQADFDAESATYERLYAHAAGHDFKSATERKLAQRALDDQSTRLADAEARLDEAKHNARGVDLPLGLDLDGFLNAPVSQRRHWLSTVIAAVVVRRSRVYREDVATRARILTREESPSNPTLLIAFAARLDW